MTDGLAAATRLRALQSPVTMLRGVGGRTAQRLAQLGIHSLYDLLWHLPLRYQDRSRLVPLAALVAGRSALFQGGVLHSEVRYARRRMLLVTLGDDSGCITLRFFHFSARQQEQLQPGVWLRCYGEVRAASGRRQTASLEVVHPEYAVVAAHEPLAAEAGAALTPVYPLTDGVGQGMMRNLVRQALAALDVAGDDDCAALLDQLPPQWLAPLALPDLKTALQRVHAPPATADLAALTEGRHPAQRRLAFEELLAQQLAMRRLRQRFARRTAVPLDGPQDLFTRLLAALPFRPTAAQQRVIAEVRADLARAQPMQRLVQGDVGSGKTLVAAAALLQAVTSGHQAVLMAPTEILAEQHYSNLSQWFAPLGVTIAWLSGRQGSAERRDMRARVAAGSAQVAVGTHALFQDGVEFAALGLVVVDEQHRFGVHQRLALRDKGARGRTVPHQLIMTATPIPRTMVMTAYADLDCSLIDELPPGRQPVSTVVVQDGRRDEVLARVREACTHGRQAYWVCTLIEESDALQCQAAQDAARLLTAALPELQVGLIHGRMKPRDKEAVMAAFKAGTIDLLVATTVIEVGVDVPNATLMVIEDADRLGLAQLHQLRGRVGRGSAHSHCVLMYQAPLGERGRQRLAILRDTADGFEVARRDLELRGPGEILGTRQTGELSFRVADLLRDQDLVPAAARLADRLLQEHPRRVTPLVTRWLGRSLRYADV